MPGVEEPVRRTYSLSGNPQESGYRISVKREDQGLVSRYLHDRLEVGAIIEARKPAGDFLLPRSNCPVVLVSAGVGVTPMASMLHHISAEAGERPVWFVQGARDGDQHPLASEIRRLAAPRPGIHVHVAYSRPRSEDVLGADYDSVGRINGALLAGLVDDPDAHYLLCGPTRFMADVETDLESRGVPPARIHSETFGPIG